MGLSAKNLTRPPGELCNVDLGTVEKVALVILDYKLTIFNVTGDTKLLALIDSGASFNFMSSLVAKHLG